MPSGAFLTLGFLVALVQKIQSSGEERARRKKLEEDAIDGGYHETLMRDPATGKIVRKPVHTEEAPADDVAVTAGSGGEGGE